MSSDNSYPVELAPPDIGPYRDGNTGVPYVTTFDSGRPGPHVMVNALTHGNELCGAIAVVMLFERGIRPVAGKLTLSFANVAAFETFDRARPTGSRFVDEDFNRLWDDATLDGKRDSVELRRARALRPVVDTVDLLLDIHSMQHKTPPLMMAGMTRKATALARRVGVPERIVRDAGHSAGRRMRDYRGFGDETSPKNALLVECGQHWERASAEVAIETTLRFLTVVGTIAPELAPSAPTPPQRVIEVTQAVTVTTDRFKFVAPYRGLEVIPKAGTVIAEDGETPVTTPYDDCVLIMPSRRLVPGQTAVRLGRLTG
jgi:predicted deacylase